jgi:hypothetical protein
LERWRLFWGRQLSEEVRLCGRCRSGRWNPTDNYLYYLLNGFQEYSGTGRIFFARFYNIRGCNLLTIYICTQKYKMVPESVSSGFFLPTVTPIIHIHCRLICDSYTTGLVPVDDRLQPSAVELQLATVKPPLERSFCIASSGPHSDTRTHRGVDISDAARSV